MLVSTWASASSHVTGRSTAGASAAPALPRGFLGDARPPAGARFGAGLVELHDASLGRRDDDACRAEFGRVADHGVAFVGLREALNPRQGSRRRRFARTERTDTDGDGVAFRPDDDRIGFEPPRRIERDERASGVKAKHARQVVRDGALEPVLAFREISEGRARHARAPASETRRRSTRRVSARPRSAARRTRAARRRAAKARRPAPRSR